MSGTSYEVRVRGVVCPAVRAAFRDLGIVVEPTATVLCGNLDQTELHRVIDKVNALGLELVDIRQPGSGRGVDRR